MMRNLIVSAALCAVIGGLSACNTVKGLGEDISSVGRAGEEAID